MSDHKSSDKSAPAASTVATLQEQLARRNAKHRHFVHYCDQAASWAAIILLAAACRPLLVAHQRAYFESCRADLPLTVACGIDIAILWIPAIVLAAILIWTLLFHHHKRQSWDVALEKAQQMLNPRNVTKGYTELFNIYMRTKRRSYLLAGWGMLAFVYVVVAFILSWGENVPLLFWAAQLSQLVLGTWLLWFGYHMGSTYLPGEVIVRYQLALTIFASSNVTDYEDARLQAENVAEEFVHDNPWWFYPG